MKVDEKFSLHRKGYKTLKCGAKTAMNLAPPNGYSFGSEDDRISVRFVPEEDENERRLVVRMNRIEAKQLGEMLVKYGTTVLDCEREHEGDRP